MKEENKANAWQITHVTKDSKGEIVSLVGAYIINSHPATYQTSKAGIMDMIKERGVENVNHYVLDNATNNRIYIKIADGENGPELITEQDGIRTDHLEELPVISS